MTMGVICGAESTIVHTIFARPAVGALICVALAAGGSYRMIGAADDFGGCGTVGGELMQVTEVPNMADRVCAKPEEEDPTLKILK